ncbi:Cholesterol oxidase [Legionella lansingensis]|uniref:Cholesterol oxidase n=1 Tax=Legionella lansingensis TaxID=45067 RepID=A0A0W0VHI0_9GAMM|nr:alpha/beta fold hydrolase [Legionella lansingensis]KTD19601.1 Cholesterol oxidase [Legionella lansingensis]SNV50187.1 Cholesterol oxidase [Legionella lansingensis]
MSRLSSPHYALQAHYPIVVIGSGYGGSIAASRLTRAGQRVCLLEKGREFRVGEYPNNELDMLKNLQISGLPDCRGSPTGLYHVYFDKEISAFVGCGLGGTSLVNANVSLRAEKRVFEDPCWPKALRNEVSTLLEEGYKYAEEMLKPTPYPEAFPPLAKMQALEKSAASLQETFYRPPINVTFQEGINHVGVTQHACKLCGDCVSGCNYAAKNTLIMNYLPDAKNHGAFIFTQIAVQYLERIDERWVIYYQDLSEEGGLHQRKHFITADLVILAAGTFGSTEILLRSKIKGLKLSEKVGEYFSGNGDVLAFSYNNKDPIHSIGFGSRSPEGRTPVGPCITGIIDMRNRPQLDEGMVIEEGSVPGGMATFLPKIMALSAKLQASDLKETNSHKNNRPLSKLSEFGKRSIHRELESLIHGPYSGAIDHTQIFLVMSHDTKEGKLLLDNNQLCISWPKVGEQSVFAHVNQVLEKATQPLGGTFISNPVWSETSEHTLVTVHPLGGCVMSDDAAKGVVNHKGQVFCNTVGDTVYDSLYVCDGAIIPRSLGVNPLLTISALAERMVSLLAKDRFWTIDYTLPSSMQKPVPSDAKAVGLLFTETMRGRLSTTVLSDYQSAYVDEKSMPMEFTVTIVTDDLDKMLADPQHQAKIIGEVSIPAFSKEPLVIEKGEFQLFTADQSNVDTKKMIYQFKLNAVEGNKYEFDGFKLIHNDPRFDIWQDTTTLNVTVYDTNKEKCICGKGILKILPTDFLHQLTTMRILNTHDPIAILAAKARFGHFFAGTLYPIYGGVLAKTSFFDPNAPPRQKRILRVNKPEVHFATTTDEQHLLLTRYRGGDKGPVIMLHGLGVSSLIFSIDTIETNLLEYLFAAGYDVWLLDYRASIALPTNHLSFSADDIALYDYPAAVAKVLEVTNARSVQMVAHCFGATTLCMAMLAGLQGVRSILFSQIAANIVAPRSAKIKAGIYLPSVLKSLGISSLTAYADVNENWQQQLADSALKFINPFLKEQCQSAVCRRISFLYGPLYEHTQLNQMTHDSLHEMFGFANLKSFEHLALMIRKGHIVNAEGKESYLPYLERLALPITFIHGTENRCFLPESTAVTYQLLQEKNGTAFYERHLIPGYGHIDCIFGKNAVNDVYPYILNHLEAYPRS